MTTFTNTTRLARGAIVVLDLPLPQARVIAFQYNPHTVTRSLQAQAAGGEGQEAGGPLRLKGAPVETYELEVEIDAADQLEQAQPAAQQLGILPQLAALEVLLYPASSRVIDNNRMLAAGLIEIVPPVAPFTLFIWGPQRVLPVQLREFRIVEELHDANLHPIQAKVSLSLRVLSYNDLNATHPGYHLFLAHQVVKETLALVGSANSLGALGIGEIRPMWYSR